MSNYRTIIEIDKNPIVTLSDILPDNNKLDILFIAKTPAPLSVEVGHYFQGRQGKMFWNKLENYNIIKVPPGKFHDDYLLLNNYGITDIVKVPRSYGNEPSNEEYLSGLKNIMSIINNYNLRL